MKDCQFFEYCSYIDIYDDVFYDYPLKELKKRIKDQRSIFGNKNIMRDFIVINLMEYKNMKILKNKIVGAEIDEYKKEMDKKMDKLIYDNTFLKYEMNKKMDKLIYENTLLKYDTRPKHDIEIFD